MSGRSLRLRRAVRVDYDLDYWIWTPIDGIVPGATATELAKNEALFQQLPRLDAIFVPGGDPGNNEPEDVMDYLAQLSTLLRTYFRDAEMWVSNQGFEHEQNDTFFDYLDNEAPTWLTGVVFGPWTKLSIQEERQWTPSQYPIRRYPDITHNLRSQFPQENFDRPFAHLLGREAIDPRPVASVTIHDLHAPSTIGYLAYSDGIHDDVNKNIWSMRSWASDMTVDTMLQEYSRFFFGPEVATDPKDGILALEDNWMHPALTTTGVDDTFAMWQLLESEPTDLSDNWR